MSDKFRCLIRVRYGDCDAQGVVFNARYGDLVDVAATEYQRVTAGLPGSGQLVDIDFQAVKLCVEWQASAKFDDVLAVEVETAHIGNTSYSLRFTLFEYYSSKQIATADTVYVCVDAENFEKMRIPDDIREQLTHGGVGLVCNQAGIELNE